jgi:glycosyltransferase involved in cell wall biosynthesis
VFTFNRQRRRVEASIIKTVPSILGGYVSRLPVTVLMPVYNGLPFLHDAVGSVLAQTLRQDWELLVVDDGSADDSYEWLANYPYPSDLPVSIHRHVVNMGLFSLLNRWVKELDSEYVAIVMQDDLLEPTYLQEMVELTRRHSNAQVLWAPHWEVNAFGSKYARRPSPVTINDVTFDTTQPSNSGIERVFPRGSIERSFVFTHCFWTMANSLTKVRLLLDEPYREEYLQLGDIEWFRRCVPEHEFVFYERTLSSVRVHAGNASRGYQTEGRDLREEYRLLSESFDEWCPPFRVRWVACQPLVRLSIRRSAGALARDKRPLRSLSLTWQAVRFMFLPARAALARRSARKVRQVSGISP